MTFIYILFIFRLYICHQNHNHTMHMFVSYVLINMIFIYILFIFNFQVRYLVFYLHTVAFIVPALGHSSDALAKLVESFDLFTYIFATSAVLQCASGDNALGINRLKTINNF